MILLFYSSMRIRHVLRSNQQNVHSMPTRHLSIGDRSIAMLALSKHRWSYRCYCWRWSSFGSWLQRTLSAWQVLRRWEWIVSSMWSWILSTGRGIILVSVMRSWPNDTLSRSHIAWWMSWRMLIWSTTWRRCSMRTMSARNLPFSRNSSNLCCLSTRPNNTKSGRIISRRMLVAGLSTRNVSQWHIEHMHRMQERLLSTRLTANVMHRVPTKSQHKNNWFDESRRLHKSMWTNQRRTTALRSKRVLHFGARNIRLQVRMQTRLQWHRHWMHRCLW